MFQKFFIMQDIAKALVKNNYQVAFSKGCFDLAAKGEEKFLLKILLNVDALLKEHSLSLRTISYFISALPFVISLKSGRKKLMDDVIYSRFDLNVLTPNTFKKMIKEEIYPSFSMKGKHVVKISLEKLKERRKNLNYSLSELSRFTNISKKCLYEIESGKVLPKKETVEKLEEALMTKLTVSFKPTKPKKVILKPRERFEREVSKKFFNLGIENSAVFSAPFNLIGKEKFSIITKLFDKTEEIKIHAEKIESLSSIFSSFFIGIAKRKDKKIDYPVISKDEFFEISSPKELLEKIEGKI